MAKVISNKYLGEDIYLLKVQGNYSGKMGQFYMIRGWDEYPLLPRPLSIHNIEDNSISFLYKVVGKGTKILSHLKALDNINVEGPYGNGFPNVKGKVALVGGGMGVAPLYLAAKELRKSGKIETLDIYMGFSEESILEEEFKSYSDSLYVTIGKNITEVLDTRKYDYILTCGPMIMMEKIVNMAKDSRTKVYVSIEKRMACGIGACLVCTCKTTEGNKKACKYGPVFIGEDVIFHE